ncbi:MAG: hypothetical protein AB7V16_13705 [Vulcanibacillus sp.]
MESVKYILLVTGFFVLGFLYFKLYYWRLNQVLVKRKFHLFKFSPTTVFFALLLICVGTMSLLATTEVNTLTNQIEDLRTIEAINPYIDSYFPNQSYKYVYTHYNNNFAGYYREDGSQYLCITNDSPLELIDYLENNYIQYKLVNNSFSDLYLLYQMILNRMIEIPSQYSLEIDIKSNSVQIGVPDLNFDTSEIQNYLDNHMITLVEKTGDIVLY